MNMYCFEATEITKKTRKVMIQATDLSAAEDILSESYGEGTIPFTGPDVDEEDDFVYEIDQDTRREDDTFDDKEFCGAGILEITKIRH